MATLYCDNSTELADLSSSNNLMMRGKRTFRFSSGEFDENEKCFLSPMRLTSTLIWHRAKHGCDYNTVLPMCILENR